MSIAPEKSALSSNDELTPEEDRLELEAIVESLKNHHLSDEQIARIMALIADEQSSGTPIEPESNPQE